MHVVLQPSPTFTHKLRVTLPSRRTIDFGDKYRQDYTDHGDARLMRAQLLMKGAIIPKKLRIETDPSQIQKEMLKIKESLRTFREHHLRARWGLKIKESSIEDWEDFFRAEYWERWILYTYPNINKAKLSMTMSHGILFMPTPEDLWYCQERSIFKDL